MTTGGMLGIKIFERESELLLVLDCRPRVLSSVKQAIRYRGTRRKRQNISNTYHDKNNDTHYAVSLTLSSFRSSE